MCCENCRPTTVSAEALAAVAEKIARRRKTLFERLAA